MNKRLLLGLSHAMLPIPRALWQKQVAQSERAGRASLSFMTDDHHRVRDLAVMELPRAESRCRPSGSPNSSTWTSIGSRPSWMSWKNT